MTEEKPSRRSGTLVPTDATVPRVTRSSVPGGKGYLEYKPYLRIDFVYSCAYCQISEAEALSVRLTIDHYEPKSAHPELEHEYANLMYACDPCNILKGDRCPPAAARLAGFRFYRIDQDLYDDHFSLSGIRLISKSSTGEFTIETLDLNRQSLRRLREFRKRLENCERFVAEGMLGLKQFRIDQLPQHLKGTALGAVKKAGEIAERLSLEIEDILQRNARSDLVDEDPEASERAASRAAKLRDWGTMYPGTWRGRSKIK